jgi:tetratricopeptide (TPR) repeat protein
MPRPAAQPWSFTKRLRRGSFGWKSSRLAIERLREAKAELLAVAATDPLRAAAGCVLLCERLTPALEPIDSSSGALGTAANDTVAVVVHLLANTVAEPSIRRGWLDRLFEAFQQDTIGYLHDLGDAWGELCASDELANEWADALLGLTRTSLRDSSPGAKFVGAVPCLAALQRARRHDEIIALLHSLPDQDPLRLYLVSALAALGRIDEALAAALPLGRRGHELAERILRNSAQPERAWAQFGRLRPLQGPALAHFRALLADYPTLAPARLLHDLIDVSPGDESLWFAAAVEVGEHDLAIRMVQRAPANLAAVLRITASHQHTAPRLVHEAALHTLRWIEQRRSGRVTDAQAEALLTAMLGAAQQLEIDPATTLQQVTQLVELAPRSDSPLQRLLARLQAAPPVTPRPEANGAPPPGAGPAAVFFAFLQPLLDSLRDAAGEDLAAQDAALPIGMLAWNGVLFADVRGDPSILAACRQRLAASGHPQIFEWLVARRRTAFAAYRWLVGSCEFLVDAAGQRRLRVQVTDPPSQPAATR